MEKNTCYQLSTLVSDGIIEIVFTGEVTEDTIDRLHVDVIRVIQGADAKAVLTDVRALKGHNDAFASAYFRARSIPPDIRRLPSAVVDLSVDETYRSFYETTAANVGHLIKWFTDIDAARTWLKSML
jgi:hypothetical protein